jgi:hypothetical protein
MGLLFSFIPLNMIPIIIIVLQVEGLLPIKGIMSEYEFAVLMAGFLMATLSIEIIKSSFFAPKGAYAWVDFIMSLMFLVSIVTYILYLIFKLGIVPSSLYILALEAQFLDVLVGFYITISNARRDFNTSGN